MKKIVSIMLASTLALSTFAFDTEEFTPVGNVSSYTKTEYSVTTKFGDYFRMVNAKYVHVYDGSGLEIETSTYNSKDALVDKVTYTYDTSRNLTSCVCSDSAGNTVVKTTLEYYADGKIKAESEYDANGNITGKIIYKYEGQKTTESYYDSEGALISSNIATVNADNKPVEKYCYYGDGKLEKRIVYTYLENGKISFTETFDNTDKKIRKEQWRYDVNGGIAEIQATDAAGTLVQRDIYKCDAKGNPLKINMYTVAEKFGSTVNELQSITEYAYK
jgi:hypothetical protein